MMVYVEPRGRELRVYYYFWVLGGEQDIALRAVMYRGRNVVYLLREESIDYICRRVEEGIFRIECHNQSE